MLASPKYHARRSGLKTIGRKQSDKEGDRKILHPPTHPTDNRRSASIRFLDLASAGSRSAGDSGIAVQSRQRLRASHDRISVFGPVRASSPSVASLRSDGDVAYIPGPQSDEVGLTKRPSSAGKRALQRAASAVAVGGGTGGSTGPRRARRPLEGLVLQGRPTTRLSRRLSQSSSTGV